MQITTENLVSAVQGVITNYCASFGSDKIPSTTDIADHSCSGVTTIRDIKKGTLKSLSVKKALEISSKLGGAQTLDKLLGEVEIDHLDHLDEYTPLSKEFENLLNDSTNAKILMVAFSKDNSTAEFIQYMWGREGVVKMNNLMEKGYLVKEDNKIKGCVESGLITTTSVHKLFQMGLNEFSFERHKNDENWISFLSNNVNDDFIELFREKLRVLFKEFNELVQKDEYRGGKHVLFGQIFDTFAVDESANEKGGIIQ
jgi:hypothetical protein